jgi:hypothetical protein
MTLYPARINWQEGDNIMRWNHVLADIVEVFGLPGYRYVTEVDADYMDFKFFDPNDRMLFLTGWQARLLPDRKDNDV